MSLDRAGERMRIVKRVLVGATAVVVGIGAVSGCEFDGQKKPSVEERLRRDFSRQPRVYASDSEVPVPGVFDHIYKKFFGLDQ